MGLVYDPEWVTKPDWWTAVFTCLLFIATSGLWIFTGFMWAATKRAADAARVSADALPIVERAYVYPEIVATGPIEELIRNATVYYLGDTEKQNIPVPETAEITFNIKNYGKTPAILKTIYAGFGVGPVPTLIGLSIPESVLGERESTSAIICEMQIGITPHQATHIGLYTAHLSFCGEITFYDIWGIEQTTEFNFVWDKEIKRMTLRYAKTKPGNRDVTP